MRFLLRENKVTKSIVGSVFLMVVLSSLTGCLNEDNHKAENKTPTTNIAEDNGNVENEVAKAIKDKEDLPEDLQAFLTDFEASVSAGNQGNVMALMDPNYVKEQHDGMLDGRTEQFISEFLSGVSESGTFKTISLNEVKSTEFIRLEEKAGSTMVYYKIKSDNTIISCYWQIITREENGIRVYGFFGAVG